MSARVWAAERLIRRRDVPLGTVGGRMAGTRKPASRKRREAARARSGSPTRIGTIGPSEGRTTGLRPASNSPERAAEVADVLAPPRFLEGDAEGLPRGGGGGGRQGGRVEQGAGAGRQEVDQPPRTGDEAADGAQGLRERPDADRHAVGHPGRRAGPPAIRPEDARAVGLVHQEHRPGGFGQVGQSSEGGEVAVHAEDPVRRDEEAAETAAIATHDLAQSAGVVVRIHAELRPESLAPSIRQA